MPAHAFIPVTTMIIQRAKLERFRGIFLSGGKRGTERRCPACVQVQPPNGSGRLARVRTATLCGRELPGGSLAPGAVAVACDRLARHEIGLWGLWRLLWGPQLISTSQ
jgi:hypothetical protein